MGNKFLNKLSTFLFYISILIFIIAFNFAHNPPSGWYQQFLPNLNGKQITDIVFIDSLIGYATASQMFDSSYILKSNNGGDNWQIIYRNFFAMTRVQFLNDNIGYACGGYLYKTINGAMNWTQVNTPAISAENMYVLNEDTIWLTDANGLVGGVFRTTNGGVSWVRQLNLGSLNPDHIYMYNSRIGFISTGNGTYKTTNSGVNWFSLPVTSFLDMYFSDSLTGWKNNGVATFFQKTTDGGLNWVTYNLPAEQGAIILSRLIKFDNVFTDTIFGAGAVGNVGSGARGLIYKSTNSGLTWGYQLPDTSIHSGQYQHIQFTDRLKGWSYWGSGGVHTTIGGDTTYYTGITSLSSIIPDNYKLYQNYPNPFNPRTVINYQLSVRNYITIKVYNALGKEIRTLVNKKQSMGEYKVEFDASGLPSGVYFYSLFADGELIDTKKMVLVR